jgi:integrase
MAEKYPSVVLIHDRYHKASDKRKAVVEMRITHNRKQKYISTGVMLYPHQWNNGFVINCPDASSLNKLLDKMLGDVRKIIFDMVAEGNIDIFAIPMRLSGDSFDNLSFLHFCEKRIEVRKYGKEKDTQQRYDRFYRFFKEWGKIRKFEDITSEKIIDYDKYLKRKGMLPQSKWHNYHRFLNSFITDAIEDGYISKNPYKWISIDKGESNVGIEKCLTYEEFKKIKETIMPTKALERIKDVFIFQTHTCLRYSDLALFDAKYIKNIKGMKVYIRKSKKTKKEFIVPILPTALNILMKYNGRLPIISNVKYNEYLKIIAQAAGVDKPLSTHWARHTGATLLLNEGVDMRIISKICGHSSVKMTEQVYAKLLDETVVDAIKGLEEKL